MLIESYFLSSSILSCSLKIFLCCLTSDSYFLYCWLISESVKFYCSRNFFKLPSRFWLAMSKSHLSHISYSFASVLDIFFLFLKQVEQTALPHLLQWCRPLSLDIFLKVTSQMKQWVSFSSRSFHLSLVYTWHFSGSVSFPSSAFNFSASIYLLTFSFKPLLKLRPMIDLFRFGF